MRTMEIRDIERPAERKTFKHVAAAVAIAAALTLAGGIGCYVGSHHDQQEVVNVTVHEVADNETLWDIAADVTDNEHDIRRTVYSLQQLNGLDNNCALQPGQKIKIAPNGGNR